MLGPKGIDAVNDMTPKTRQFGVTESAAKRIAFPIESGVEPDAKFMRVAILGGGCSGFQYEFFDTEIVKTITALNATVSRSWSTTHRSICCPALNWTSKTS